MVCKPAILNIKQLWELNGSSRCHEHVLQTVKEDSDVDRSLWARFGKVLCSNTVNHIAITIIRHNKQSLMRKAIWTFDRTIFGSSRDRNFALPFLKDFSPVRSQRLFSHSFEQVVHKWPRAHDRPTFSVISPSLYSSSSSDSLQKKR